MNFNNQLNEKLFKNITDTDKFCRDGLVMKYGEPENSVDEKWGNSERRVAFILKDNPDGWATDLRTWLNGEDAVYKQNRNLCGGRVGRTGFLPNIARMFYGLYSNPCIGFNQLNMAEVKNVWNEAPFALIESKKIAGTTTVSQQEIKKALETDSELLQNELDILQPNIVVCCDPQGDIFKFVTDHYMKINRGDVIKKEYNYPNVRDLECRAWYFKNINVVVILSYHPSRIGRGKEDWKIYERVVSPFRAFSNEGILSLEPLNKI